jgi:hypothetical protein
MVIVKEPWNIKLKSGKSYKCTSYVFLIGLLRIAVGYVSLGLKNGDLRVSVTWGSGFTQ